MWRDQRAEDNWALHYAQEKAIALRVPLIVAFTLAPAYLGARGRSYVFMLRGLRETALRLQEKRLGFVFLQGDPADELGVFMEASKASLLVTDFCPLRPNLHWQNRLTQILSVPIVEVDAHNIVPCRTVSNKEEYAARTIRPKINRLLPEYLFAFPEPQKHPYPSDVMLHPDWDQLIQAATRDTQLIHAPVAGAAAAHQTLDSFIRKRLMRYNTERNDPNANASSGISPTCISARSRRSGWLCACWNMQRPVKKTQRPSWKSSLSGANWRTTTVCITKITIPTRGCPAGDGKVSTPIGATNAATLTTTKNSNRPVRMILSGMRLSGS